MGEEQFSLFFFQLFYLYQMKSVNYSNITIIKEPTIKTGNKVFDTFLSNDGGFVLGGAIFLTGTAGAGKTTLAIIIQKMFENYVTSLYSREMSAASVHSQMKRYKIQHHNAYIADKSMCPNLDSYIEELNELKPVVVIIDSLQFIMKEDYAASPPDKTAFDIIQKLRAWTEANNAILIVVGHVNKNGEFEGRNTIEHMFDAHLEMIYNKAKNTRTLSWSKNRKGTVDAKLFYLFGEKSIEFYTAEDYNNTKDDKTFEDFIIDAIVNYLNSLDKNTAGYKKLSKELKQAFCKAAVVDIHLLTTIINKINKFKI
jgi:Predicted ATP-dependent serine protease